ncbi:quinone oxidoreductase family protein [Microbacterium sp. RD1]|uniref:quinone oxidoreductase family protein n=1 Tax=Microbacterium sp. RD1 TaxID=3457313 RepID=UPI003FA5AF05
MPRAVVYTEFGGPEVLTVVDIPSRAPAAGEIRVRVEAIGVNPIDAKLRSGLRPSGAISDPRRLGFDAAGVVVEAGDGVEGFRPGTPVALFGISGAYADEVTVAAASAALRPTAVSASQGAALGVPVGTAYQALRSLAAGPGDVLFISGGSGAVGRAAIQFAVRWGARVVATSSDRRAAAVAALGATPVRYGDGLLDRVRDAAPEGVTVALDAVGTDEALETSITLVADRGRIGTLVRGAQADDLDIQAWSGGSPHPLTEQQVRWRSEAMPVSLALLEAGAFAVEQGPVLPLAEAAEAHRLIQAGTDGKILLVP